ncbi:uncharacterized protein LOC117124306 [Anneissia japonica]|uniref:uncharacterized protein LOC117124306 n=1 Tax=Anneissia japonica TaxID=1529436 RepID=UPI0014255D27|nr:uncharacterized protein LOC117124306 [Anneissia japonica]
MRWLVVHINHRKTQETLNCSPGENATEDASEECMRLLSETQQFDVVVHADEEEIDDSLWDVTPPEDKDNISDDVDDDIENSSYEIDERNVEVEVNMKDGEEGKIVEGLEINTMKLKRRNLDQFR